VRACRDRVPVWSTTQYVISGGSSFCNSSTDGTTYSTFLFSHDCSRTACLLWGRGGGIYIMGPVRI
jgi:hypothetical protein